MSNGGRAGGGGGGEVEARCVACAIVGALSCWWSCGVATEDVSQDEYICTQSEHIHLSGSCKLAVIGMCLRACLCHASGARKGL